MKVNWHTVPDFKPLVKKVSEDTLHAIQDWVEGEELESRVKLGRKGMSKTMRQKALQQIANLTKTKVINGQKHYLLHRSMGWEEAEKGLNNDTFELPKQREIWGEKFPAYTSWGTDVHKLPKPTNRSAIVSSWVPESHISFYPQAYSKHLSRLPDDMGRVTLEYLKNENEAIVKPGKFNVIHVTSKDSPRKSLGYDDIDSHEDQLHRKLSHD